MTWLFYMEEIRKIGLRREGARVWGGWGFDMSFLFVYIVRIKVYSKKGKGIRDKIKKVVSEIKNLC